MSNDPKTIIGRSALESWDLARDVPDMTLGECWPRMGEAVLAALQEAGYAVVANGAPAVIAAAKTYVEGLELSLAVAQADVAGVVLMAGENFRAALSAYETGDGAAQGEKSAARTQVL